MPDESSGRLGSLLAGVRDGDEHAVRDLIDRFEPMLRRVLRVTRSIRLLQGHMDSEDLVQSVFIQAVGQIREGAVEFEDEAKLEAYLKRVGRNRLRDALRRLKAAKRNASRVAPNQDGALDAVAAEGPSPSRVAQVREEVARVERLLPKDDLEVIQERIDGVGWKELAARRGLTEDSLRKRIERVRRLLAEASTRSR